MTGHPQGTNRGVDAAAILLLGSSSGSAQLSTNSSGLVLDGGLKIKNTTGQVKANSTALIVAKQLGVGAKATYIDSNSTGVRLGGAGKYIKTNSTGN